MTGPRTARSHRLPTCTLRTRIDALRTADPPSRRRPEPSPRPATAATTATATARTPPSPRLPRLFAPSPPRPLAPRGRSPGTRPSSPSAPRTAHTPPPPSSSPPPYSPCPSFSVNHRFRPPASFQPQFSGHCSGVPHARDPAPSPPALGDTGARRPYDPCEPVARTYDGVRHCERQHWPVSLTQGTTRYHRAWIRSVSSTADASCPRSGTLGGVTRPEGIWEGGASWEF